MNPDDHDRILTDPAYRMEKTSAMHKRMDTYILTLNQIEQEYLL